MGTTYTRLLRNWEEDLVSRLSVTLLFDWWVRDMFVLPVLNKILKNTQLEALEFLHEQGFVHADVKVSNIVLGLENKHQVYFFDMFMYYRPVHSVWYNLSFNGSSIWSVCFPSQIYLVDYGCAVRYLLLHGCSPGGQNTKNTN